MRMGVALPLLFAGLLAAPAWAEDITATTYYPSPRGVYNELRTKGDVSVGDLNAPAAPARLRVRQDDPTRPALQVNTVSVPVEPALFVAPNGNVGIRTSNPLVPLHVFGEVNASAFRAFESSGVYAFMERGADNDNLVLMGAFRVSPPSYAPLSIDAMPLILQRFSGGNVGIGTPGLPAVDLAIRDEDTGLELIGNDTLAVFTGGQIRTVVDGNGRLGIGTVTPLRQLHVDGSARIDNGSLAVPDGSVGIGTLTPASKLHVVDGDIQVTNGSFVDDGTALNVPDYVLGDGYRLMSLAETASYIGREGHLPGVPPADDRTGWARLSLQARDMLLLEKIEELTVHLTRQEARIAQLEAALAARPHDAKAGEAR